MENLDFNRDINSRSLRIALVDGTSIHASVNIDRSPGYDRLSDLVSSDREPFLILMDATVQKPDLEKSIRHKSLFINKEHILWAAPDDDQD